MVLNEYQKEKLGNAKLKWEDAFIASPCGKRCLCLPFNQELNKTYEENIKLEKEISSLFALMTTY